MKSAPDSFMQSMASMVVLRDLQPVNDAERVIAPNLVAREAELELLRSTVSSPPAVVSVEGEAGLGKTRLVNELAALLRPDGCRWLLGACRRVHGPFPLGPVIEAVRGAASDLR